MSLEYVEVACGGGDGARAHAWVDDDDRWNGWLKPLFPYDEVAGLLDQMVEDKEYTYLSDWAYAGDLDRFEVYDESINGWDWYAGVEADTPEGTETLYPIGSSVFTWNYARD